MTTHDNTNTTRDQPRSPGRQQQLGGWGKYRIGLQVRASILMLRIQNQFCWENLEKFLYKKKVLEELTEKFCTSTRKDIVLVRLPVGHSELNAIELIWALVKTEVAKKNTTFKISDVLNLTNKALNNVTSQKWSCAILLTRKIEKAFCEVDFGEVYPTFVDNVIIGLNADNKADSDTGSSRCESTDSEEM